MSPAVPDVLDSPPGNGLAEVTDQFRLVGELENLNTIYIMLHGRAAHERIPIQRRARLLTPLSLLIELCHLFFSCVFFSSLLLPKSRLNIMFLIARVVKLCHFQPRLGLVTRTIAVAAADMGADTNSRTDGQDAPRTVPDRHMSRKTNLRPPPVPPGSAHSLTHDAGALCPLIRQGTTLRSWASSSLAAPSLRIWSSARSCLNTARSAAPSTRTLICCAKKSSTALLAPVACAYDC